MPSENVKLFCLHSKYRLYRRSCYYYLIHPKRKNKKSFSKELEECFTHQQDASISTIFCFWLLLFSFLTMPFGTIRNLKTRKYHRRQLLFEKTFPTYISIQFIHVYQGTTRPWAGTNDYSTYHPDPVGANPTHSSSFHVSIPSLSAASPNSSSYGQWSRRLIRKANLKKKVSSQRFFFFFFVVLVFFRNLCTR